MIITRIDSHSEQALLGLLKQTRLKGFDQPLVYENATLQLKRGQKPLYLYPAQNYVMADTIRQLEKLYYLFLEQGHDIFALEGYLNFWVRDEKTGYEEGPIPLLPPIVEYSPEGACMIPLINDGMHRIYTAKRMNLNINVVRVYNVPECWPYYAYPLLNRWEGVEELEFLPEGYSKKVYRNPENYKDLFRNFNALFPGVQKPRASITQNPVVAATMEPHVAR